MAYDLEKIQKQIEEQRGLVTKYGQYTDLPTGFEYGRAISERLKPDEELIRSIAKARSKMLAIPAEVRARQKPGWVTPQQVSGLIAGAQQPLREQWQTLMGLQQARTGRIENVLGRVTKMIDADIQKQKNKYDQAVEDLERSVEERNTLINLMKPDIWGTAETGYQKTYYDPTIRTWKTEPTGVGGEVKPSTAGNYFTETQLAKGATSAGMSIEEFGELSIDEANKYIFGEITQEISRKDIEDTKADIRKRYEEKLNTIDELKEMVQEDVRATGASNATDVEIELLRFVEDLKHRWWWPESIKGEAPKLPWEK